MRLPPSALAVVLLTGVVACAVAAGACAPDPAPEVLADDAPFALATDSLVAGEPALRYAVALGYPQLRALDGEELSAGARAVNAAVRDTVRALARDFRPVAPPGGVRPDYPVRVSGGPTRAYVSDRVLSALVTVTAYTGGAHPNTFFLPLTYDLATGRPLAPADLFTPGTPWPDTLAAWTERTAVATIARRLRAAPAVARAEVFAQGLVPIRQGDVAVTLGRDSLRVHVPPYQLSSRAAGGFDVGVPYAAVRPFARPGSALADRAGR